MISPNSGRDFCLYLSLAVTLYKRKGFLSEKYQSLVRLYAKLVDDKCLDLLLKN